MGRLQLIGFSLAVGMFAQPALAGCFGSASFYTCNDASGNQYTVSKFGNTTTMNGSNFNTGSQWNQTSNRFGNMTVTNGQTNGRTWNESQTRLDGGNVIVNGTNSHGMPYHYNCNPYTGCR